MFDRFVRLAQARKAVLDGQFEFALRLVDDPLVSGHRKADALRQKALDGLVERSRRRADAGALSSALAACEAVLVVRPDHGAALALRDELRRRVSDAASRGDSVRALVTDAKEALARGDVKGAAGLCDAADALGGGPEVVETRRRAELQLVRATEALAEAVAARRGGRLDDAIASLARARGQSHDLDGAAAEAVELAAALAPTLVARLESMARDGDVGAARMEWQRIVTTLPELSGVRILEAWAAKVDQLDRRRVCTLLEAGDLAGALDVARRSGLPTTDGVGRSMEQLGRAVELAARGEFEEAARVATELGEELDVNGLRTVAASWRVEGKQVDASLARARGEANEGRLLEGRNTLLEILRAHPAHAIARREVELLEQGAEDRERRIAEAREFARGGNLRTAAARLVSLTVPGPQGDEARVLLRDLQQRMDTVSAGIRQVLRSMHGRDSATREGLQHCARRLGELESVQRDHEELPRIKDAALAESEALQQIADAADAIARADLQRFAESLGSVAAARSRLLSPDRLDARVLELVDEALSTAERTLEGGWTARTEQVLNSIGSWGKVRDEVGERVEDLRRRIAERRTAALECAELAREALERHEIDLASSHLDRARTFAADDSMIARLAESLTAHRTREARLADVETMADGRDFDGAHRELVELGPTPSLMRTRIFDLKNRLARAQGLENSFLLRVDEGGEFLVFRSESASIGNLRDGSADLPMLANLAGRHARLRRSMSFHGGQEDQVIAERGEVWIGERTVDQARLTDRMRFRLGGSVEFEYRLPTERSLTALLRVRGGFRIAGTDRLLWMKDRGRDGRILIGAGPGVHVTVEGARDEVELFANRDGQIRVRCTAGGEIDGRPFQGEHPVAAGAVIRCAGVAFVLLPWNQSR